MRLFGGDKAPPVDIRAMLGEAARDLGGDLAVQQALHFFDAPKEFLEQVGRAGEKMSSDKLASEILGSVLIDDNRIYVLDWAEGGEGIIFAFDHMMETLGAPAIEPHRREQYIAKVSNAKRGEPVIKLMESMREEVEARGLQLHWWYSDGDAYLPLVLTPQAYDRWSKARFGKKHPVLP